MMGRTFYFIYFFISIVSLLHFMFFPLEFLFPSFHPPIHNVAEVGLKLLDSNVPPIPTSEELGLVVKATVPSTQLLSGWFLVVTFYGARD